MKKIVGLLIIATQLLLGNNVNAQSKNNSIEQAVQQLSLIHI